MDMENVASIAESARLLGVSSQAVREWCIKGRLAYVRTPLGRVIDRRDLERLIREREQSRQAVLA